ncbi:MAG: UvrB/UvrC motif-containing protein [Akkermansia sp.]|nr:UvrB/UvrC motif-containing protein [Akkermansia sp.]
MKKCQICGKRASIYLTQIINGQATDLALCETCAREKGLFDPQSLTFAEKFFPEAFKKKVDKLVKELIGREGEASQPNQARQYSGDMLTECPACHFTLGDFRRCGRLGCPDCYTVFAQEITAEQLADNEAPNTAPATEESIAIHRSKLEQQLQAAINREDYETAAALRDELKKLN